MGQPLHLRGCLLLAAASASYGAAPDARARSRLRGPAANASSALVLKDRRLPAPTSRALVARRRLSGDYAQLAKLVASDAAADDKFGSSVAIDGDTIVAGAPIDAGVGSESGSVYVLRTIDGGATYDEMAKLTASDAASLDLFGYSVAIDGDTIVVGASRAGTGGATYVFLTTDGGATYVEVAKLTAADAAEFDAFGASVAIDGDTIVVGTSRAEAVYVFRTTDGAPYR